MQVLHNEGCSRRTIAVPPGVLSKHVRLVAAALTRRTALAVAGDR